MFPHTREINYKRMNAKNSYVYRKNKYFQLLKLVPAELIISEDSTLSHRIIFALNNTQNIVDGGEISNHTARKDIARYILSNAFTLDKSRDAPLNWSSVSERNWLQWIISPDSYDITIGDDRKSIKESTMCCIQKICEEHNPEAYASWKAKWTKQRKAIYKASVQRTEFVESSTYKFISQLDESHYRLLMRKELYAMYSSFCVDQKIEALKAVSFGKTLFQYIDTGKKLYIGKYQACDLTKEKVQAFLSRYEEPKDSSDDEPYDSCSESEDEPEYIHKPSQVVEYNSLYEKPTESIEDILARLYPKPAPKDEVVYQRPRDYVFFDTSLEQLDREIRENRRMRREDPTYVPDSDSEDDDESDDDATDSDSDDEIIVRKPVVSEIEVRDSDSEYDSDDSCDSDFYTFDDEAMHSSRLRQQALVFERELREREALFPMVSVGGKIMS